MKKEMTGLLPETRSDTEITPLNEYGDRPHYLVKNPLSGEVFEFGIEDYFLYRQFDGRTTFSAIKARFEDEFHTPISLLQLEAFASHLLGRGLLSAKGWQPAGTQSGDNFYKTIGLGNPDRLLSVLDIVCWWCFTPPVLVLIALFLFLALGTAMKYHGDFLLEIQLGFRGGRLLLLPLLGIFVVNVGGEIAKAVACKHFGGYIGEAGVILRYRVLPRLFFDMADSLWRQDKMTRVKIMTAGLLFELLLWSVAVIAWRNTPFWSGVHTFWMLMALAAAIIIFLNINPLLQRDGYFLISNWLEIPGLRERAMAYLHSWFLHGRLPEPLTVREKQWLQRYGVAVLVFETVFWGGVLGGIGYLLMHDLKGIGAVIFLLIIALRFEHLLRGFFSKTKQQQRAEL